MEVRGAMASEVRRLRRAEFDELVKRGYFDDERVELLDGVLFTKTQGADHSEVVDLLNEWLIVGLKARARVRVQGPVAASEYSEPEPDLTVLTRKSYRADHPSQALWIIEVSDSSLKRDRGIKQRLYAQMRVPEYWIVNLREQAIEVRTEPAGPRYTKVRKFGVSRSVAPAAFPDLVLRVASLF